MYLVQEFQINENSFSVLPYKYDNWADAQEKYHDILRVAVKSNNKRHGAVIFDEYFEIVAKESFTH